MATIKSKIIVNVVIVLLAVIAIVSMNYFNLHKMKRLQDEGGDKYKEEVLAENASNIGFRLYAIIADAEINRELDQTAREWTKAKEKEGKLLDELGKKVDTQEEKERFAVAKKAFDGEIALFEGKMLPLLKTSSGITDEIKKLDGEIDKLDAVIQENLEKVSEAFKKDAKKTDDEFDSVSSKTITQTLDTNTSRLQPTNTQPEFLANRFAGATLSECGRLVTGTLAAFQSSSEGALDFAASNE